MFNPIRNAKWFSAFAAAVVLLLGIQGSSMAQCVMSADGSGVASFKLLAGQTIEAGTVTGTVANNTLQVTFSATGGWELSEAHLWVGSSIIDLPQTKTGNPVPGQFPYKSGNISGATSYTFTLPLASLNFSCPSADVIYYLAAHAALRKANGDGTYQTETGWSQGSPITTRGSWATFSTLTLTCNCGGGGEYACETSFAKIAGSSTCFSEYGFQRWGWTNGPLAPGNYVMDIYAGAGQCDISKGALSGRLYVSYNGTTATVSYEMQPGFFLQETHLYVGNAPLPLFKQGKTMVQTVAPGQYPYIHDELDHATSDVFTVSASGTIYVVAHSVTCTLE